MRIENTEYTSIREDLNNDAEHVVALFDEFWIEFKKFERKLDNTKKDYINKADMWYHRMDTLSEDLYDVIDDIANM